MYIKDNLPFILICPTSNYEIIGRDIIDADGKPYGSILSVYIAPDMTIRRSQNTNFKGRIVEPSIPFVTVSTPYKNFAEKY